VNGDIDVDPEAVVLIDLGHIFWRAWHKNESRVAAYEETVDRCQRMAKRWPNLIVCADSAKNWRHALTEHLEAKAQYKANRKPKPKDAFQSLLDAEMRIEDSGVRFVKAEGFEADDVIATLKAQAWLHRVIIMTEDKDLAQLVDDNCLMWTRNGERGPADIERTYGVLPPLMRDLLAMWGDASDNIPGCPDIGQGFACKLLNAFGSIDAVKAEAEKPEFKFKGIGPERIASIRAWDPELAVKLVSLATDAPVNLEALLGGAGKQEEWPTDTIF
jgi:5'-3' exonuclease